MDEVIRMYFLHLTGNFVEVKKHEFGAYSKNSAGVAESSGRSLQLSTLFRTLIFYETSNARVYNRLDCYRQLIKSMEHLLRKRRKVNL